jgi:hypothetical protein
MKKVIAILTAILILNANIAQACYNAQEFEAEQGLRIHSELMVIGLTCIKMPQGQELFHKYKQFTAVNSNLIAGYEQTLISHYASQGAANPEKKFHTFRTNIANEISQHAISMSTLSFCQKFSSHLDEALAMDQAKLRRWAQHRWPNQPMTEPMCSL